MHTVYWYLPYSQLFLDAHSILVPPLFTTIPRCTQDTGTTIIQNLLTFIKFILKLRIIQIMCILKTSSTLSKYYNGHIRTWKLVLQRLIYSSVRSHRSWKHKIPYNLNTVQKSNSKTRRNDIVLQYILFIILFYLMKLGKNGAYIYLLSLLTF
jgi:hypothetical protein